MHKIQPKRGVASPGSESRRPSRFGGAIKGSPPHASLVRKPDRRVRFLRWHITFVRAQNLACGKRDHSAGYHGAFSLFMMTGCFVGDYLNIRFGPMNLLRISGALVSTRWQNHQRDGMRARRPAWRGWPHARVNSGRVSCAFLSR